MIKSRNTAAVQATLTVDSATVDRGGNVTVTGTFDCVGTIPLGVDLTGSVRQSVGRLSSVTAEFATTTTCGRGQRWTALAQPSAGKFVGGPATVNASAGPYGTCNIVGCTAPSVTVVITLRR
jgi:hypothetical protein